MSARQTPTRALGSRLGLGLLLLATGVLAAPPTPDESADLPAVSAELARRVAAATVLLTTRGGRKTGVLIGNDGQILTCLHGSTKDVAEQVTFADGTSATARPVGGAVDADLALLQIERPRRAGYAFLAVGDKLAVGDAVVLAGTGGQVAKIGLTPGRVTRANVAATIKADLLGTVRERFYRAIAVVSGESMPGDSGGPMVTGAGTVVGIVSGVTWGSKRTIGCPAAEIARLLPELRRGTWVPALDGKEQVECFLRALPADLQPLTASVSAAVAPDLAAAVARVVGELRGQWVKATRLTYDMTVTGFERVEGAGEAVVIRRVLELKAKP